MSTTAPQTSAAPPDAGSMATIAEDRLEGAAAIGRFIDPTMTLREIRRRLERGDYPHWREGRLYVASKAALLAHWRRMTTQLPDQPRLAPKIKSARRGYRAR